MEFNKEEFEKVPSYLRVIYIANCLGCVQSSVKARELQYNLTEAGVSGEEIKQANQVLIAQIRNEQAVANS